jgi:hypothetical protein
MTVNDTCQFLPRNFVPIPPFLLDRINTTIDLTDGNGIAVLLAVIEEITDYDDTVVDKEVSDDESQTEDVQTSCIDIVYWLYLTMKGKIYSTPTLGELQTKSSETAAKSFKRVPPQYQHMMIIASSQGSMVSNEINDEAKKFFASPDRAQAQLFLNTRLEEEGIECTVSTAMTTLFTYGNLIWTSTVTPSGLLSMVISSKDLFPNESQNSDIAT